MQRCSPAFSVGTCHFHLTKAMEKRGGGGYWGKQSDETQRERWSGMEGDRYNTSEEGKRGLGG